MATEPLIFLTNDPLTRKKWARDLFRILLPAVEFNDLVGTSADAIVQMKNDLAKGVGDTITFGIRLPLTGEGVVGQMPVEGNEERLAFRNFKVTIEELNHAVDTGSKMDEQRIPYALMEEGKMALNDWWAAKLSDYMFANLCGDTSFLIAGQSFATAITDPDAKHWMCSGLATGTDGSSGAEAAMTAANYIDLSFLDKMKQRAELMDLNLPPYYKVRPIRHNGKNYYRVFLHNYCFDALRTNMNAGQWGDIVRSGQKLQIPNVEFEYNGLIVSKSQRVRASSYNTTGNVYRNFLVGAQAACWAWGGAGESHSTTLAFVPYEKDAKRFVMIRGGGIFGMTKTKFGNSAIGATSYTDFGIVIGSAWGAPLA